MTFSSPPGGVWFVVSSPHFSGTDECELIPLHPFFLKSDELFWVFFPHCSLRNFEIYSLKKNSLWESTLSPRDFHCFVIIASACLN